MAGACLPFALSADDFGAACLFMLLIGVAFGGGMVAAIRDWRKERKP